MRWLDLIRLIVFAAVLVIFALLNSTIWFLIFVFLIFLTLWMVSLLKPSTKYYADLLALAVIIGLSGGRGSLQMLAFPFSCFGYHFFIPLSSFSLLYPVLLLSLIFGLEDTFKNFSVVAYEELNRSALLDFIAFSSSSVLLSFLAFILANKLRQNSTAVTKLAKKFENFLDAFTEPVIICKDSTIIYKNEASRTLNLSEADLDKDHILVGEKTFSISKSNFVDENEELTLITLKEVSRYLEIQSSLEEVFRSRQISGKQQESPTVNFGPKERIAYKSKLMEKLIGLALKVSKTDANVLICGESGTGKTLLAKFIHETSERANYPFLAINCAAIPEDLLEAELFGAKKGAYTGSFADRKGAFLEAQGGVIFLDEIGDMPLRLQGKLLRVLQEKVVKPLGSDKEFPVDVRVMTATNKNLEECVKQKTFREDLFYRINVVKLVLPPLRDRKEDIPVLVENFLARTGRHLYIHPEAWRRLIVYDYPGNVRELENLLERACLLAEDAVILPEHLNIEEKEMPQSLRIVETDFNFPMDLERFLAEQEKAILTKALEQSSYNKSKAAKLLNLTMRSLRYRLSKYNLHY